MQHMPISLSADTPIHQIDLFSTGFGLTTIQQIWPRTSNAVLDEVCQDDGEEDGDEEAEVGNVDLVDGGTEDGGPDCETDQGDAKSVDEEVPDGDAFDDGVRVVDVEVGKGEEAVKGHDEALDLWRTYVRFCRSFVVYGDYEKLTRNQTTTRRMSPM